MTGTARKTVPWGVHTLAGIFARDVQAGLPDGRWVIAVAEPYTANRLQAAWWVFTGRAYALRWPEAGELEDTLHPRQPAGRAALQEHGHE